MPGFYSEFAKYYDLIFPFREKTYQFLKAYITDQHARLLDVGCGIGNYVGRFVRDGYEAEGIDLDPEMIKLARNRYPNGRFYRLNMQNIDKVTGGWGLIFCLGNVVSHLSTTQLERFLTKVRSQLTHGGCWVFQVVNWDYLLTSPDYQFPIINNDAHQLSFHREYRNIHREKTVFKSWLQVGDKIIFDDKVWLYPCHSETYIKIHNQHGLENIGHFADFDGKIYHSDENSGNVFVFKYNG